MTIEGPFNSERGFPPSIAHMDKIMWEKDDSEEVQQMKAKLQVAEEMAIALRTIGDLPQSLIGKSVQEYASRLYAAWEKAGKGEG